MKRIITYIAVCLALTCCTDEYEEKAGTYATLTPGYLQANPTDIFMPPEESTEEILVTNIQTPWKIDNGIQWLSVTPTKGSSSVSTSVQVKSDNYTTAGITRIGILYLRSDVSSYKREIPITVMQAAPSSFIILSKNETDLPGSECSETVTVTANCKWTAVSSSSWLKVNIQGNTVVINADANNEDASRTATVSFTSTEGSYVSTLFTVRQITAAVEVSSELLEFNINGGTATVNINSETSWTATSSDSWINILPTEGKSGNVQVSVNVAPNPSVNERTGYVYVIISNERRIQIPIKQKGIYIETEQQELSFASTLSKMNLQINSNTDWMISDIPSWISITPDKGNGNATIEVSAVDNPSINDRKGAIHITHEKLGIDVNIPITQKGKTFDVNTTLLNFEDKASSQNIDIETDGTWNAVTSDNWITLTPTTNSGKSTLNVSVSENTGDNERTGQVTVTMCDKTATIFVTQTGKFFTISEESLAYTSTGGTIDIAITTNDTWTATIEGNPSWLKLSKNNGSGNIEISAVATDNPSVNSRSATILFETKYSQSIKVVVTQAARYFSVDTYEFLFYPKGGNSEAVTITTDGKYKITCSDTWFSVSQTGNTFIVTATENTSPNPRTGTVTVEITDLKEGKLSATLDVMQLNGGSSIFRQDFGDDTNYDITINTTLDISKTDFAPDTNYDISNNKTSDDITKTEYGTETNYDITVKTSGGITKTDFENDNNWD